MYSFQGVLWGLVSFWNWQRFGEPQFHLWTCSWPQEQGCSCVDSKLSHLDWTLTLVCGKRGVEAVPLKLCTRFFSNTACPSFAQELEYSIWHISTKPEPRTLQVWIQIKTSGFPGDFKQCMWLVVALKEYYNFVLLTYIFHHYKEITYNGKYCSSA